MKHMKKFPVFNSYHPRWARLRIRHVTDGLD